MPHPRQLASSALPGAVRSRQPARSARSADLWALTVSATEYPPLTPGTFVHVRLIPHIAQRLRAAAGPASAPPASTVNGGQPA